jgi:ABC-type bacteriocin/lantibiotic exporter with double-glycine peptidase domain
LYKKTHVLSERKKVIEIKDQLNTIEDRVSFIKRTLVVITSIIVILNLFTLFYYFNSITLIVKLSALIYIFILILIMFFISHLKNNAKKLKFLIYQKQKL